MFSGWNRIVYKGSAVGLKSQNFLFNSMNTYSLPVRAMSGGFNIKKNPKNRMLYFRGQNKDLHEQYKKPKTIQEMKKLQSFVHKKVSQPGESLTSSILTQAKRDESFNDFLKE